MSETFYARVVHTAEDAGLLDADMRVLVIAGGQYDRETLLSCGYRNVTISNVDIAGSGGTEFAPYSWDCQHAERLTFADASFDAVIVHAGLHHCRSPHAALAEMYRVARRCAIVVEARDSFLTRLAIRLGLTTQYELEAVVGHGYLSGGVENSGLPNFVYRWTEREVDKTVRSLDPSAPPNVQYVYGVRVPLARLAMHRNILLSQAARALSGLVRLGQAIFPRQGNLFGFIVGKPDANTKYFPWVAPDGTGVNREWYKTRYFG
jgi:SAM-dependent methyltransferase